MNRKGIVLSGLIYALLAFFLLLVIGLLAVLWYRQNAIDELSRDANAIYDDPYIPSDVDTFEFVYTGDYQALTIPKSGKYKVELWGAQGSNNGGKGGYTSGEIYLEGADILYIYVGGTPPDVITQGYNGGGAGMHFNGGNRGRAGGGATDIRLINGTWDNINSLRSRIMVAGGGAGSSGYGGAAGGLVGLTGTKSADSTNGNAGTGGTQISGGISYNSANGTFGKGADAIPASGTNSAGAGGGGYYGGGTGWEIDLHAGGGGGSSFISGHPGCDAITEAGTHTGQPNHYSGYVFRSTQMKAGNESMPSPTGGTQTGNTGNGFARITYIPEEVNTAEFIYTGDYQTYVIPESGNYKIELWGASGGGTTSTAKGESLGGNGAYTTGQAYFNKGASLYFYIGQSGGNFTSSNIGNATIYGSTFNGGGAGALDISESSDIGEHGFPGGGATDVRIASGMWNNTSSLRSRIMVAAGGGGGGWSGNGSGDQYYAGGGGSGGTLSGIGAPTATTSTPGTQTNGSAFGIGGNGIFGSGGNNNGTGGGGGGYYGGEKGLSFRKPNSSGSGGSSFISGHAGCNAINASGAHTGQPNHYSGYVFTNTQMIPGNELMPNPMGGVQTGHLGNGFARITYLP